MKSYLKLFVLIFIAFSCGKNAHILSSNNLVDKVTNVEASIKDKILERISGTYEQCIPSVLYSGYYSKITHILIGDNVSMEQTLSASSDCSTPYYLTTNKYKIVGAAYVDNAKEIVNIDAKWQSQEINFKHNYYIGQNYCGYTDWALNITKALTGASCPSLLSYDSHHSSFKDAGDDEFLVYKVNANTLSLPLGYDESGDTSNDRKNSKFGIIEKL
jgi:hypothetical protein